jgi:hypothetical protein
MLLNSQLFVYKALADQPKKTTIQCKHLIIICLDFSLNVK